MIISVAYIVIFYSILEPELECMKELYEWDDKWKYFINLSGMEFPLVTNGDLVRILKIYDGANEMEGKSVKLLVIIYKRITFLVVYSLLYFNIFKYNGTVVFEL